VRKQDTIKLLFAAAILGAVIGIVSDAFIRAIQIMSRLIWSHVPNGSGYQPWAILLIAVAGGVITGLCVKFFGKNEEGIGFESVLVAVKKDGELGFKQIKRVVLNAYAGLVSGASIGPESPLVTLGGFCGDLFARLLRTTKKQIMAFITISLGGSIGILFNSPVAGPVLFAEEPPTDDSASNKLLVFASMMAASIGFAVYAFLGAPFIKSLKLVPAYAGFKAIDLLYGLLIGIIGTLVGLIFRYAIDRSKQFFKRLDTWPVGRGAVVGLIVGACGAISPLVMFDGSAQLSNLVAHVSTYSITALLSLAVIRLISTSVALGGGYQGGNIFPSIFIAGAIGLAIHKLLPFIPAPVAMVSCMASVMYVFLPLPL
jgi:H+/Cl- antiporter ClcA